MKSRIILTHTLTRDEYKFPETQEQFTCLICNKPHPTLYTIYRTCKAWGHFPTASINGTVQVIDPTLPHELSTLPRDAQRVPDNVASIAWHGSSHYFTLNGIDHNEQQLKQAIKELNERIIKP